MDSSCSANAGAMKKRAAGHMPPPQRDHHSSLLNKQSLPGQRRPMDTIGRSQKDGFGRSPVPKVGLLLVAMSLS